MLANGPNHPGPGTEEIPMVDVSQNSSNTQRVEDNSSTQDTKSYQPPRARNKKNVHQIITSTDRKKNHRGKISKLIRLSGNRSSSMMEDDEEIATLKDFMGKWFHNYRITFLSV